MKLNHNYPQNPNTFLFKIFLLNILYNMFSKKFGLKIADLMPSITYNTEKDLHSNQNVENYIRSYVIPSYNIDKINEALKLMSDANIKDE